MDKRMLPKFKIALTSVFLASTISTQVIASQADIDAEIAGYIATFKANDFAAERKVMDKLVWAGYSSESLYDVIAADLKSVKNAKDKQLKKQSSWYAKILATSGNDKYRTILKDVAANGNKKAKKHAMLSLERLATYKVWNPIISAGLIDAPSGKLEATRVNNMLKASDYELLRIGAKRLYRAHPKDQRLLAVAKQRLTKEWSLAEKGNGHQLDAIAWLIKAVAETGDTSLIPLLEDITNNSKIKKVKGYAEKYLKLLQQA